MDTLFFAGQGFYLRGKVRDLLAYLGQFDPDQRVIDFTYSQLH